MNRKLPDGQTGFRKGRGIRDQIANICWIAEKAEVDVFLELSSFLIIQWMLPISSLVPLPFLKQLEHLEVHSSHTFEAWLGEF